MNRKAYILTALVGLILVLMIPAVQAEILATGETFPATLLFASSSQDERSLGLTGGEGFPVRDIPADAVLIEFFSMYCPHCQADAPDTVTLYELIQTDDELYTSLKFIGIGITNSDYEVEVFREEYEIPFPLFSDKEGVFIEDVGVRRTPTYMLVTRDESGDMVVVFTQVGKIDDPAEFFEVLREHLFE